MDANKRYKVVYSDGSRERVKDLVFIKKSGVLLEFYNPKFNIKEFINELRIIRMEELEDGSKTDKRE